MQEEINKGCCPGVIPTCSVDPITKFSAALSSLTRLYEDLQAQVSTYDGDIEALKEGLTKEINDRIAADAELKAALETFVLEKVAAEATARENGDAELLARIEELAGSEIGGLAEKIVAEASIRQQADADEKTAREEEDAKLNLRIDNEIEARTSELQIVQADVALLKPVVEKVPSFFVRVDQVEDKTEVLQGSVELEISERAKEIFRVDTKVNGLENRIVGLETKGTNLDQKIEEEKAARMAADESLENKIADTKEECTDYTNTSCQGVYDRALADISTEAAKREQADMALSARIGQSIDQSLAKIAAETTARELADTNLQNQITAADAKITQEIKDRRDAVLEIKSDYATKTELNREANLRTQGDENVLSVIGGLEARIGQEVVERAAADTAINNNIGVIQNDLIEKVAIEKANRESADEALGKRIDDLALIVDPSDGKLEKELARIEGLIDDEREEREAQAAVAQGAFTQLEHRVNDEVATRTQQVAELWEAVNSGGGGGGEGDVSVSSTDFSCFAVWANDITVPTGAVAEMSDGIKASLVDVYGEDVKKITIAKSIAPGMTHKFHFRTVISNPKDLDVVVDWGDGTSVALADVNWNASTRLEKEPYPDTFEWDYVCEHTYTNPGKYYVKLLGRNYFDYCHAYADKNLVCEIFSPLTRIASFVTNISSMYQNCDRLLTINAPYVYPLRHKSNLSGFLSTCKNLYSVIDAAITSSASYLGSTFADCTNLTVIDTVGLGAMPYNTSLGSFMKNCSKCEVDVGTIFSRKILASEITVTNAFLNCKKMFGTVPAQYLWDDTTVKWLMSVDNDADGSNKLGPFYGCSDEIREQVPLSWGGSNAAIKIKPYDPSLVSMTEFNATVANSMIKVAAISQEAKELIKKLEDRIKMLEDSGSGGVAKDYLVMLDGNTGRTYKAKVINDYDEPTITIESYSGSEEAIQSVFMYGNDGKKYEVEIVADEDGDATFSVKRAKPPAGTSVLTGIKLNCTDDEAEYVLKVQKPADDDAVIALVPFGA